MNTFHGLSRHIRIVMARPIRVEFAGAAYHVTARGNERREIFRDDTDRLRFLQTVGEACDRFGILVHAYCLMPNHYHLLLSTPRANLSRAIGWVQTAYCVRFNRRHGRVGHLVQGRFKAHVIDADAYAKRLVRYVHLNPVRPRDRRRPIPAERREFFEQYLWSSHRAYAGTARKAESPGWLCTEWLSYWDDGSGRRSAASRAYVAEIDSCFGRPLPSPLAELRGGLVLGDDSLWAKVRKMLSHRPRSDELRWLARDDAQSSRRRVAALLEGQEDPRVRSWARVRLGGAPAAARARELGYADGSGVYRVVHRLEATAREDKTFRRRLERLKEQMSSVKS